MKTVYIFLILFSCGLHGQDCGSWGYNPYDFNNDCIVNAEDLTALAESWQYRDMISGAAKNAVSIQALIDGTPEGGEVVLAGGVYGCSVRIDKDITLRSADGQRAVIDAAGQGVAALSLGASVSFKTVIKGIDFINGQAGAVNGGGAKAVIRDCSFRYCGGHNTIYNFNGLLDNCLIEDNTTPAKRGLIVSSSARISGCVIRNNTISSGNSIFALCSGIIENNLINGNTAGAACFVICDGLIRNNTITGNNTPSGTWYGCEAVITNNIDWGNNNGGIKILSGYTSSNPTYCVLDYYNAGDGNQQADPLFVSPQLGDFCLQAGSVCIDSALASDSPFYDINYRTRGSLRDIGAYEKNTETDTSIACNLTSHNFGTAGAIAGTAAAGDVIEVYPGIISSSIVISTDIILRSVRGAQATVVSTSSIAFNLAPSVTNAVIDGFKVSNCSYGVYARNNGGLIKNCIFSGCQAVNLFRDFRGAIKDCVITGNNAVGGSLIKAALKSCDLSGNMIEANSATGSIIEQAGGLCENNVIVKNGCASIFYQFEGIIRNNTIADNIILEAAVMGGKGDFVNNILWDNSNNDFVSLSAFSGSRLFAAYCDIEYYNGPGFGNISLDPQLDKDNGYSISRHSAAIDKGLKVNSPARDINGNPRTGRPDIGAYEYFPALGAGAVYPYKYIADKEGDINTDGIIDSVDLTTFVQYWLECTEPEQLDCVQSWMPPQAPFSPPHLAAAPIGGADWTSGAVVVQPWGVSVWDLLARENVAGMPQYLMDTYGINTIIINPLEAHNRVGSVYYLDYDEMIDAINLYKNAGFKVIIYSSIIHCGHFSTWESGLLSKLYPDWAQRASNGATCDTYGNPWLSPATDAFDYTVEYAKQLVSLYSPDAIMLDNSQLMWGRDVDGIATGGPTDYSDGAQRLFKRYLDERYGSAVEAEFGIGAAQIAIPDETQAGTKLYRVWMDWRNRFMAQTIENFRKEINPTLLFANTAYEYGNWYLATDMQLRHEDVVLSETRGKPSKDITLKLMLGKAFGYGRPIWNYMGTFSEDNINILRPADETARIIAATLARCSNPWLVYYGFNSNDSVNMPSRQVIASYLKFRREHSELYENLTSGSKGAYIFSTRDHNYRGQTYLSSILKNLQAGGIVMDGLEDIYLCGQELANYSVVVASPEVRCLSGDDADMIIDYTANGGRFVATKDIGDYDEYGFEREGGISVLSAKLGISETAVGGVSPWWNSVLSVKDHNVGAGKIHLRTSSNMANKVNELLGARPYANTSAAANQFVELFEYRNAFGDIIVHTVNHDYTGTPLSGWTVSLPFASAANVSVEVFMPDGAASSRTYSIANNTITIDMPTINAYSVIVIKTIN